MQIANWSMVIDTRAYKSIFYKVKIDYLIKHKKSELEYYKYEDYPTPFKKLPRYKNRKEILLILVLAYSFKHFKYDMEKYESRQNRPKSIHFRLTALSPLGNVFDVLRWNEANTNLFTFTRLNTWADKFSFWCIPHYYGIDLWQTTAWKRHWERNPKKDYYV